MNGMTPEQTGTGRPRRTLRLAIQLAGFLAGLGLLVWCASLAFSEKNRAGLERLGEASAGEVSLLAGPRIPTRGMFKRAMGALIS